MIKKILLIAGALLVSFLAYGFYLSNTPAGKERGRERDVIASCWQEQERESLTSAEASLTASACEKLEDDFRRKWSRDP